MSIEATRIDCTFDANEARILVYALKDTLDRAVKDHWLNHGLDSWQSDVNVKLQLSMMKQLFSVLGQYDLYTHYHNSFVKALTERAKT